MKKSQIFTIVACSAAALLLTGVLAVGLSTDSFSLGDPNPQKAKTHRRQVDFHLEESPVESLDIYWVDGKVEITQSPDSQIHIIESSEKELAPEDQMEATVSGGTLNIKWDGQWYNKFTKWISFGWFQYGGKELTVQLPPAVAAELDALKVSTTAGDVDLNIPCQTEEASFSTTSGQLRLPGLTVAEALSISSVSGNIILETAQCQTLRVSTTSGQLALNQLAAEEADISSTSGDCGYTGTAGDLHMNTVSGCMQAGLTACPEKAEMSSVSGHLTLALPENPGFTVEYSTVSGAFSSDFPVTHLGKEHHMSYGNGQGVLNFHTTSGDIFIEKGA